MVTLYCAIVGVAGSAFPVDINETLSVGHLKEVIKTKKPNDFKDVDADKLHLFLAKAGDNAWLSSQSDDVKKLKKGEKTAVIKALTQEDKELDGEFGLVDVVKEMPEPKTMQIHVLVVVPDQQQAASIKKQLRYNGMSTEASCRKFLDVVAQNLTKLYDFDCSYGDVPTIGDVFNAVQKNDWGFRVKRGKQLTGVELSNYFTEDEWNDLKDLNRRTNRCIHDGKVPTTSKGKPYIILPHPIFSGARVDRYKDIATKASVVWEPTEFEVKDEDEFSGSSRSSSGRSDGA